MILEEEKEDKMVMEFITMVILVTAVKCRKTKLCIFHKIFVIFEWMKITKDSIRLQKREEYLDLLFV